MLSHFFRARAQRPDSAPPFSGLGAPSWAETHPDVRLRASSRPPPTRGLCFGPLPLPARIILTNLRCNIGRGALSADHAYQGGGWREPTYLLHDHGIHAIKSYMVLVYIFKF